jgi:GT2 family glycosyltransferase/glycosyltransferase involved in cell wall biosynthesis
MTGQITAQRNPGASAGGESSMDTNVPAPTAAAHLAMVMAELNIGAELDWQPDYQAESAWHEHIPFAFWLVKALQPRSIVELGTHWGVSYAAFCQAVDRCGLAARCHAVDTWEGDPHAGEYDGEVFAAVSTLNEARWHRFSTLLRSRFDEARAYFGVGEVDLLHIDGFHTYEAAAGDFATWRDTLSDCGVVLFHDVNVREREFGVWRFWRELKTKYPHFEFHHGHGLGVLGVGSRFPAAIQALFAASDQPLRAAAIRGLFAARGDAIRNRWLHRAATTLANGRAQQIAALRAETEAAQRRLEELGASLAAQQEAARAQRDQALAQQNQASAQIAAQLSDLAAERDRSLSEAVKAQRLRWDSQVLSAELDAARAEAAATRAHRDAMAASTSWRLTKPLRVVARLARGDRADILRLRAWLRGLGQTPSLPPVTPLPGVAMVQGQPSAFRLPAPPPALPLNPTPRQDAVDIVICVHNAPDDVRRCLATLLACTMPPYRLVLVDDGSAAETRDLLAEFAREHPVLLIRHEVAEGYTRAANAGLRATEAIGASHPAPWLVLLNSDTLLTPGWLDRMVEQGRTDGRIGIIGPLSNTASWQSVPQVQEGGDWAENPLPAGIDVPGMARIVAEVSTRQAIPMPFLNGFCLLIRRSVLQEVGLFDEERFGEGYGEENDYCIRARKAAWKLVVADDAFVFHAQSRSYSHDRRRKLVERADRILVEKHDPAEHIWPQVLVCRDSLAMAALRARIAAGVERRARVAAGQARWEGRRIGFLLPVQTEGGGANVVIQETRALRRMGVDVTLLNLAASRAAFEASYPDLGLEVRYGADEAGLRTLAADPVLGLDAVVATLYASVAWLPASGPIPAYYIQDFEPWFFPPADPEHAIALATYRDNPALRRFTKSDWNAKEVANAGGLPVAVIGPSVDADLFRPAADALPRRDGPVRVAAMVRPSTPRRQPELTVQVLQALRARFGAAVELTTFGADETELAGSRLDMTGLRHGGRLGRADMALLLRKTDVFLDLSDYQAMGLTALEAMASGCAVLVPARGGASEFSQGGRAALVAETTDAAASIAAATRLVEDAEFRAGLRLAAVQEAPRHAPEFAAFQMLEAIFGVASSES